MLLLLSTFPCLMKKKVCFMCLKYTTLVVLISLSHDEIFVFIIVCYLTQCLAVFHSYEIILILDIEIKQRILNIVY